MLTWTEAVTGAVHRVASKSAGKVFTRQQLLEEEGARICSDTGTTGLTPMQTVSRELQQLRDAGVIEFMDERGKYRLAR